MLRVKPFMDYNSQKVMMSQNCLPSFVNGSIRGKAMSKRTISGTGKIILVSTIFKSLCECSVVGNHHRPINPFTPID